MGQAPVQPLPLVYRRVVAAVVKRRSRARTEKASQLAAIRKLLLAVAAVVGAAASVVSLTIIVSCEEDVGVRIPHLVVYNDGFVARSVLPNTVIEVRGTGFRPGETLYVGVRGFPSLSKVMVEKDGRFALPSIAATAPGAYTYVGLVSVWGEWVIAVSSRLEVIGGSQ